MSNEEYFNDEEFRELLDDYENTVAHDMPVFMDADDLADIADYYQMNDRQEDARRAIERAVELQPDSVVALNYLIHEALNVGDYQEAEERLEQIVDKQVRSISTAGQKYGWRRDRWSRPTTFCASS